MYICPVLCGRLTQWRFRFPRAWAASDTKSTHVCVYVCIYIYIYVYTNITCIINYQYNGSQ